LIVTIRGDGTEMAVTVRTGDGAEVPSS
jgi:hypothetical protein